MDLIVCPSCQAPIELRVAQAQDGEITEGTLTCRGCGTRYPITNGIPRLLAHVSDSESAASFGFEWSRVDVTDFEEDVVTFFRKTGLDERIYDGLPSREATYPTMRSLAFTPDGSWLAGKLVLDAGCGMGRYLNVAKEYGCEIVGMDFSRSVERAAALLSHAEHVHVVQGDLFAPPFRPGTFEYVYSIGCIHHTLDPPQAFRSLASLCRSGGWLSVYVYPPDFWLDPIRGRITRLLRRQTVRLPHARLLRLCERVALPLGLLQMKLAAHPFTRIIGSPLFLITIPRHQKRGVIVGDTFDTYSAKYIWTYTPEQVCAWFRAAGFDAVRALPYATTVKGQKHAHAS